MDGIDNNGVNGTDVTNNEISTIIDEIVKQNIDNNNIDNIDFTNLDDSRAINYIYFTVFDKIDDIIKEHPNIKHMLKNNKYVIAMINNNIPKLIAYAISFVQIILLILVMSNNLPKKNEDCNDSDSEDDCDVPDINVD